MKANGEKAEKLGLGGIVWRIGVVGIGYLALLVIGGASLTALGAGLPQVEDSAELMPWILLSGVLIGIVLGSLASRMSATRLRQFFVWMCLLFLNGVAVVIEGLFFVPELINLETAPVLAVQQLIVSVGTAMLVAFLFTRSADAETTNPASRRSWYEWLWRVAASVLIYVALFYVVGGLNYALVTRPFYEQQGGLAIPEASTVLAVETMRGILIIASILPFILTYQTTRRRLMVSAGLALFVVGGVVPLMLQAPTLPGFLLLASGWEIFLQLFPTGIATTALLTS